MIVSGSRPCETVRTITESTSRLAVGSADTAMTEPTGATSSYGAIDSPIVSRAALSATAASSKLMPTRPSGTVVISGPCETASSTEPSLRMRASASGVVATMVPGTAWSNTFVSVASRPCRSRTEVALSWELPMTSGTVVNAPGPLVMNHHAPAATIPLKSSANPAVRRFRRRRAGAVAARCSATISAGVRMPVPIASAIVPPVDATSRRAVSPASASSSSARERAEVPFEAADAPDRAGPIIAGWSASVGATSARRARVSSSISAWMRRTSSRAAPASIGRFSGSRAASALTSPSISGGSQSTTSDGTGMSELTCR